MFIEYKDHSLQIHTFKALLRGGGLYRKVLSRRKFVFETISPLLSIHIL